MGEKFECFKLKNLSDYAELSKFLEKSQNLHMKEAKCEKLLMIAGNLSYSCGNILN